MVNPFKETVYQLNDELNEKQLTKHQKQGLFQQTRTYIFLQDLIESLETYLEANEKIQGYLPLTTDGNFSVTNAGLLGMHHPKTKAAREYIKDFKDLRGNRLLVFTDQRIIFMTIIEFIDEKIFYSYPYKTIQAIMIKKKTVGTFDWSKKWHPTREKFSYYFLDFQSENHIFTDILSPKEYEIFKEQLTKIPELEKIPLTEKVHRNSTFDKIFSNTSLIISISYVLSYGAIVLFIIWFIWYLILLLGKF